MTVTPYRRIFLFLPLLFLALNACGNKGALYIPPPPIEPQGEVPAPVKDTANE